MKIRKAVAMFSAAAALTLTAACGAAATDTATSAVTSASTSASTAAPAGARGQGGPGGVDLAVSTEEELVTVVQEAYGDGGLDLHRGHQPVQTVLDEVLGISHDELHVRMEEQSQNLSAVATDLGIDPQTLIDAMVDSWAPAIDSALAAGAITQDEAAQYRSALEDAFTFRVTWDRQAAMPAFTGV